MNKSKSKFRRNTFRTIGFALGVYLISMGILMFWQPIYDTTLEKLGALAGIMWGSIFIYFSFTGKNPLRIKDT
jgi:glucose uptake protein GlcU